MSFAVAHTVPVTTSSGVATAYTPNVTGRVISIAYTKTDFADGVDFTITTDETAQDLWVDTNINASETVAPRQPTHSTAGVASVYDGVGSKPVEDYIVAVNERIKIVIAQGGDAKTGSFLVIVG